MNAHPIDIEALRREAQQSEDRRLYTMRIKPQAMLDFLDLLAAAEHRATRAEAQSAIRGRAVVIYRERAREAEAEARTQRHRADDMEDNALRAQTNLRAAKERADEWRQIALEDRVYKADLAWKDEKRRADKAEQRLAAWMDEYRRATHTGAVNEMMSILEHDDHTLRYGSPTTPCGQGPCCLGDGHEGNCRM